MTDKKKPPFRADHVGSLLRPKKIREAFKEFHSGKIDKDEFISGITGLGFTSPMEIDMLWDEACQTRYEYKLNKGK